MPKKILVLIIIIAFFGVGCALKINRQKYTEKYQPLIYWSEGNNSDGEKTVYKWNGLEVKQLFKVPATTNDIFLFNENLFTVIDAADDDAFYNADGEKITTPPYPLLDVNKLSFGAYQTIYNTKYSTVCDNNTANCEIFNLNTKEVKTFSAATVNNNAQKNYILQPLSIHNDSLILSVTTHDGAPDRSSPFKIVKVDLNQPKNYVTVWDSAQIADATANAETDIFLTNTDTIKITRDEQNPNNYHFANLTSGQTSVLESAAPVSMSPSTKYLLLTQTNSIDAYSNYDHFSIINAADGQNVSVSPLDDDDQEFIFLGWENNADRDILFLADAKRLLTLDATAKKVIYDQTVPFNIDAFLAEQVKILNLIK